mgnify:CR=1 FL=1
MKKFLIILSLLSVPLIFQWDIYQVLKLRTFDAFVTEGQPSDYFAILNITEEDGSRTYNTIYWGKAQSAWAGSLAFRIQTD